MIIIYNQLTSIGWSSNTIKQPAPWSSIPLKTLSRIICDNFDSTCEAGRSINLATCAISTHENGSIIFDKFCSKSVSYNVPKWERIIISFPSSFLLLYKCI